MPVLVDVSAPLDHNLLQAKTIGGIAAPEPTYAINWLVEFHSDETGVNRAYVNNKTYVRPAGASATGKTSVLFDYLQNPSSSNKYEGRFHFDPVSHLNYSIGDGANPFVLPFNKTVMVLINNTDGGEHPIHLHGHNFWVVATSDYPEAETLYKPNYLLRDIVGVPALGWAKIIFTTDNPGVWLLHCHIDWHFDIGLATAIIEAPEALTTSLNSGKILPIPNNMLSACSSPQFNTPQPTGNPTTASTAVPTTTKRNESSLDISLKKISVMYNQAKGFDKDGCLDATKLTTSNYYVKVQCSITNTGERAFVPPSSFLGWAACYTPAVLNFWRLSIQGGKDIDGNAVPIELLKYATCVIDDSATANAASCIPDTNPDDHKQKPQQELMISKGGSYGVSKTVEAKFLLSSDQYSALTLSEGLTFSLSVNKNISPGVAGVVSSVDGTQLQGIDLTVSKTVVDLYPHQTVRPCKYYTRLC